MITEKLYSEVLLNPFAEGGKNELYIVSGYASATFARHHLEKLVEQDIQINLIIGMPTSKSDHGAYIQLHKEYGDKFRGYYLNEGTPVHSKVYAWFKDGEPMIGYSGSANYSQFGFFGNNQVNQMTADDPVAIKEFFETLIQNSVYIPEAKIELADTLRIPTVTGSVAPGGIQWIEPDKSVRISLLDASGEVPLSSGLNWGHRGTRNRNEAYLSLKQDARKEGFLPERGFTFTLVTDDGVSMDCVRAQDGDKAIETTNNNSELGIYFRNRLGLESGALVTVEDLERYSRTDFTLVKIDDENFQLDFSTN